MSVRLPDARELRIIVAIAILCFWMTLTVADALAASYRIDPFVNAAAGAAVAWLFGSAIRGGDG